MLGAGFSGSLWVPFSPQSSGPSPPEWMLQYTVCKVLSGLAFASSFQDPTYEFYGGGHSQPRRKGGGEGWVVLAHPLQAGEPGGYVDPCLALFFPFVVCLTSHLLLPGRVSRRSRSMLSKTQCLNLTRFVTPSLHSAVWPQIMENIVVAMWMSQIIIEAADIIECTRQWTEGII